MTFKRTGRLLLKLLFYTFRCIVRMNSPKIFLLIIFIITVAASSSKSLTITGISSNPASSQTLHLRCPAITSYPFSGCGRTIPGIRIPYFLTLSTVSCIFSSSTTRNGWSLKAWKRLIGTKVTTSPDGCSFVPNKSS